MIVCLFSVLIFLLSFESLGSQRSKGNPDCPGSAGHRRKLLVCSTNFGEEATRASWKTFHVMDTKAELMVAARKKLASPIRVSIYKKAAKTL